MCSPVHWLQAGTHAAAATGTQGEHASIWYSPAWALGVSMVSAQESQLLSSW